MTANAAAHNRTPDDEALDLTPSALEKSLRATLPPSPWGQPRVIGVRELTPGLSGSRVFRVSLAATESAGSARNSARERQAGGDGRNSSALPASVILKIPDWGAPTGIASRDPWVRTRELHFYESGPAAALPASLRAPETLGIDRAPLVRGTWLWTEDEARALANVWGPADAIEAAARVAGLHDLFRARRAWLERQPWLEREGYAAHRHHVPAARRHLDRLASDPRWAALFTRQEQSRLRRALDLAPRAVQAMRRLPPTLVHGDFHIGNMGFDRRGGSDSLVAVDWAHAGVAPLGSDIATLISLYSVMGGAGDGENEGRELQEAVTEAYVRALRESNALGNDQDAEFMTVVTRACGLWHLTWGLHLRLGPGLSWLLRRPDQDSVDASRSAADIRSGCMRALASLPYLEP